MNEFTTLWQCVGSCFGLLLGATCYSVGGRAGGPGKWCRRYLASFIISSTIVSLMAIRGLFHWQFLAIWPLMILAYTLGYGGHSNYSVVQRILITILQFGTGALICFSLHTGLWLLILQGIVGLTTAIFAFRNPIYAPAEEILVCLLNSGLLVFYPFVVVSS